MPNTKTILVSTNGELRKTLGFPEKYSTSKPITFRRGDATVLKIGFLDTAGKLAAFGPGASQAEADACYVQVGVKEKGKYDTATFIVTGNVTGIGADDYYEINLNLNTTALNTLLAHGDANDLNDIASVELMFEITWSISGGGGGATDWMSSEMVYAVFANDVNKNNEGSPAAASTPITFATQNGLVADLMMEAEPRWSLPGGGFVLSAGNESFPLAATSLQMSNTTRYGGSLRLQQTLPVGGFSHPSGITPNSTQLDVAGAHALSPNPIVGTSPSFYLTLKRGFSVLFDGWVNSHLWSYLVPSFFFNVLNKFSAGVTDKGPRKSLNFVAPTAGIYLIKFRIPGHRSGDVKIEYDLLIQDEQNATAYGLFEMGGSKGQETFSGTPDQRRGANVHELAVRMNAGQKIRVILRTVGTNLTTNRNVYVNAAGADFFVYGAGTGIHNISLVSVAGAAFSGGGYVHPSGNRPGIGTNVHHMMYDAPSINGSSHSGSIQRPAEGGQYKLQVFRLAAE